MYMFPSLDVENREFVTEFINGGRSRDHLSSVALAKAIADELAMVAGRQEDIRHTYRITLEMVVASIISNLNELVIIDCPAVTEYVRGFYLWRYRVAFEPMVALCPDPCSAVEDFLGIQQLVNRDALKAISSDPATAMRVYNKGRKLVANIIARQG